MKILFLCSCFFVLRRENSHIGVFAVNGIAPNPSINNNTINTGIDANELFREPFRRLLQNTEITDYLASSTVADVKTVETLIQKGADVNGVTSSGWTPLMFAADKGWRQIAETLLKYGADVQAQVYLIALLHFLLFCNLQYSHILFKYSTMTTFLTAHLTLTMLMARNLLAGLRLCWLSIASMRAWYTPILYPFYYISRCNYNPKS